MVGQSALTDLYGGACLCMQVMHTPAAGPLAEATLLIMNVHIPTARLVRARRDRHAPAIQHSTVQDSACTAQRWSFWH